MHVGLPELHLLLVGVGTQHQLAHLTPYSVTDFITTIVTVISIYLFVLLFLFLFYQSYCYCYHYFQNMF